MKSRRDELESYPLAKQYGWRKPRAGGLLFLFPPTVRTRKNLVATVDGRHSLEAIHPHDLTMSAREATEFLHSRIPFQLKRKMRRGARRQEQG